MHELILLRHAEALPASSGDSDTHRRLSGHGEQEARAAGAWLAQHGTRPDRVLCSPAERARATAELALAALNKAPSAQSATEIYDATPGELLALLDQHEDAGTVMLVGHNPGIERLVALLVEGRSDEFRGMPPGGLAVLHLDGALEPGSARLGAFWSP
ncbi:MULTISPECIES: SixA phosphatase family protein [Rhodanobacter]|jgi:phosphohistidine phosphatase SixA|uniref:Histidine phosphatase family protein n=2 Tax=Rhodanobacter TaxID=75309 RepID=A0A1I4ESI2_9GAMM|nr:histidine phosphatase family protein [Rhodanobacter glycinis]QEE26225.1 histidine phosphatase family protein [Rhodanobacter glycinis]SFL07081.1 phosphohistidine phosphatase SixA [Rhodanobacter glycinis]